MPLAQLIWLGLESGVVPTIGLVAETAGHADLGKELAPWTMLPFVCTLLAIAVLPLVVPHWWERNLNKAIVAALFALPIAIYLAVQFGHVGVESLVEKVHEYVSFIVLLATLFVITGGIYVQGELSGTPLLNSAFLGFGAVLANVIGTTGASVLLIRPLLRANRARQRKAHLIVFFIFVVSNCGGMLTPLGDPPLFLGFLKGVPFEWTLGLWRPWLLINGILVFVFNIWDQVVLNREERDLPGAQLERVQQHEPLRILGQHNFVLLLGVVGVIYASGRGLGNGGHSWPFGVQEVLMAALALVGYATTPASNRANNQFTFAPIIEVAVLFAGIFVTMAPALLILNAWGQGHRDVLGVRFGLSSAAHFFWATGALSSFLDNAPTYLTFAATAAGLEGIAVEGRYLDLLLKQGPEPVRLLAAISCGAVAMGANTYIGNGPNFMVKAIAEENGVAMPSFFGYMAYSGAVLLPIFGLVTYMFFV